MCPNQRDEAKRKIGVWLYEEEIASLDEQAANMNIDRSELIRRVALGGIKAVREESKAYQTRRKK